MGLLAGAAEAQVSRVFVSVNGNDANVCSDVATPCRTIGGGVTQVDAQGEVIIIASGSYAGGTITKPVKVNAASGVVAFSGLPIEVNPGLNNLVVIRGLTLKAATPGSGYGLTLSSGWLSVEDSVIDGWDRAIQLGPSAQRLHVGGSVIRNNNYGILAYGSGHTHVENTRFLNLGIGAAYAGYDVTSASLSNCEVSGGGGGMWNVNTSQLFIEDCRISDVTDGLYTTATMRVSRTIVTKSTNGAWNAGGTFESFGTNVFRGNAMNTQGMITTVAMQ
jgi:hypothetical protein